MTVHADTVRLFDLVDGLVIDFVFGVRCVCCVGTEFGTEIGVEFEVGVVGKGLEDLREEDVLLAETVQRLAIKCGF